MLRSIVSASSGRSEARSVFPRLTVLGRSGFVPDVGLGEGVQKTPYGKVRQRSKSRSRRSEDERQEQQRGTAASGSIAPASSVTAY